MPDEAPATHDPRWGQEGREGKAQAILATLQLHCGRDLTRGGWLDIGCGSGGVAAALATHVEHVVGLDPEPWERWQAFCQEHPNLDFHAGSYRDMDGLLGADSMDVVVCNQVYEHVDDPVALLRAIHQVMKPDGVCYFAGPNLLWPIEPHVFWPFVHWLPRAFAQRWMRRLGSRHSTELDAWSWPYWKLTRAFRHAGLQHKVAVHERIRAETDMGSSMIMGVISRSPRQVISAVTPMAPGFIFVLTKRPREHA